MTSPKVDGFPPSFPLPSFAYSLPGQVVGDLLRDHPPGSVAVRVALNADPFL